MIATTRPVPTWPGDGLYPGSVWIIAVFLTFPVMTGPFFCTELATITAMNCRTVGGGFELLPERLVQVPPHAGVVVPSSKPLSAFGPDLPLIGLFCSHCEPQKYTVAPGARFTRSPMTNARNEYVKCNWRRGARAKLAPSRTTHRRQAASIPDRSVLARA